MVKMEQEVLEIPEFSRKFTEVLYGYQQERHLCDCLIITTNGCIPAHRLILVMTSPYFHQIESKRYIHGCTPQDSNFTVPFKNEAAQTIIRLLYTGKLFVSKENILQLAEICSFLKLKEALSACIKYVEDHNYHGLRSGIESAVSSRNDGAVIPEESNFHKVISRRKVDRDENLEKYIQMKKGRNLIERQPARDISSKSLMVNGVLLTMDEDGRLVKSKYPVIEQHQDSQKTDDNESGSQRTTRSTRQKYASSAKCKSETVSDKQKKSDLPMSQTSSFQSEMSMMHSEEKSNAVGVDIGDSHSLEENTECSVRKESKSPKFDKLNASSSLNSIAAETAGNVSELVSSEYFTAAGTVPSSQSSESVIVQERNSDSTADQVFSDNMVTKNEFSKEAVSEDSIASDNVKEYNTEEQRNEYACANGDLTDNLDIIGMEERTELADNVGSHDENSQGGYLSDATILSDAESSGDEWSPGGNSSDYRFEGKNTKKRKQPAKVRADVKKARVNSDSENSTSFNSAHLSRNCSANEISQSSTVSTKHSVQQVSKSLASLNETSSIVQVNETSSSIQQEKFDTVCENQSRNVGSSGISTMSSIDQNSVSASDKSTTQQKASNNEVESAKEEKITYACYVCKKEFEDPNLLVAHRKEMHPPKPYSRYKWFCDVCPYKAVRSEILAEHKFKRHNIPFDEEEFELHKCHYENCDYSSLLKSYLLEHIKKSHEHDGVKSAVCEVCGKGFRDKLRLKRHMETHRNKEDRIVCTCSICGKGFVREMILEVHMKNVHLKQQEIRLCHLCPYSATTKISLANHLLKVHEYVHKDYKVHKCNKCDFQAIVNKDLTRHMKFHESDGGAKKKYKCFICEKRFACKDYLQSHLKRHRAETLYCEYDSCSYSTKRSFLMKAHVKGMHTDVDYKPFKCHLCEHRCKLKGNLNKHIEGKHKVKVTTLVDKRREALDTGKGFFDLQKELSTKYSENVIKNALVNE